MKETAELLMDLAEARIRDGGYGGFSFRELAAEAGIRSASVHHHFRTKSRMTAAVARRYGERLFAAAGQRATENAEDAILLYRSMFRASFTQDGQMCLCGVLGAESGVLSPEVVCEIQSFFRRCIDDLSQRIGGPDARARAFHVIATLEGAMMLARTYGSVEAFDQAAGNLLEVAASDEGSGQIPCDRSAVRKKEIDHVL